MLLLGSPYSGICLKTGEGALLGPSAVGVGDSEGDLVHEARLRICLFVFILPEGGVGGGGIKLVGAHRGGMVPVTGASLMVVLEVWASDSSLGDVFSMWTC